MSLRCCAPGVIWPGIVLFCMYNPRAVLGTLPLVNSNNRRISPDKAALKGAKRGFVTPKETNVH